MVIYNFCGRYNDFISINIIVFKFGEGVVAIEVVKGSLGGIIKRIGWRFVRW